MFIYPLEVILAVTVIGICFWFYQKLVKSTTFRSIVNDTVDPPGDTDDEVIISIDKAVSGAKRQLKKNTAEAKKRKSANDRLENKLNPRNE